VESRRGYQATIEIIEHGTQGACYLHTDGHVTLLPYRGKGSWKVKPILIDLTDVEPLRVGTNKAEKKKESSWSV
jgi:hypothetical protein